MQISFISAGGGDGGGVTGEKADRPVTPVLTFVSVEALDILDEELKRFEICECDVIGYF